MRFRPALAAAAMLLLLSGCVPTPEVTAPPTGGGPTAGPTSSPRPTPTATPSATPSAAPETEPVGLGCSDLLSAQEIYDYNPNLSLVDDFAPSPESLSGQAVAQQGLACRLINQTSGSAIDIGLVRYTEGGYPVKLAAVSASSSSASAFDGYFDVTGEGGTAQALPAPYWLTITSQDFVEGADVAALVKAAVSGL